MENSSMEVDQVAMLNASFDGYGGVIVNIKELMDGNVFTNLLRTSISQWRQQGKKGIWLKLSLELVDLVNSAVKEGFRYHHAEPTYLMLVYWIPKTNHTLPANASHRVGVAAFVLNTESEVLVVQEKSGRYKGTGVWKLPTGVVEEGDEIRATMIREVKDEFGIDTEYVDLHEYRRKDKSCSSTSDLFMCFLKPTSHDTGKQDSMTEAEAAQIRSPSFRWMPVVEYFNQPFVKKDNSFDYNICREELYIYRLSATKKVEGLTSVGARKTSLLGDTCNIL